MGAGVAADIYDTSNCPKVLIKVYGIPARTEKVRIYQAGSGRDRLISEINAPGASASFIDYFPELSFRGKYIVKCDDQPAVLWQDNKYWPQPSLAGWLRDAHKPQSENSISFIPRGNPMAPGESNFLVDDSGKELGYEGRSEIVDVLGSNYPVVLGTHPHPPKVQVNLFLCNPVEIGKAQRLLTQARLLCLQIPPGIFSSGAETFFTPVEATLAMHGEYRAVLSLQVTQVSYPRSVYQPDRLIGVFRSTQITWGQAQANAQGYSLFEIQNTPSILLGDKPKNLFDWEAYRAELPDRSYWEGVRPRLRG